MSGWNDYRKIIDDDFMLATPYEVICALYEAAKERNTVMGDLISMSMPELLGELTLDKTFYSFISGAMITSNKFVDPFQAANPDGLSDITIIDKSWIENQLGELILEEPKPVTGLIAHNANQRYEILRRCIILIKNFSFPYGRIGHSYTVGGRSHEEFGNKFDDNTSRDLNKFKNIEYANLTHNSTYCGFMGIGYCVTYQYHKDLNSFGDVRNTCNGDFMETLPLPGVENYKMDHPAIVKYVYRFTKYPFQNFNKEDFIVAEFQPSMINGKNPTQDKLITIDTISPDENDILHESKCINWVNDTTCSDKIFKYVELINPVEGATDNRYWRGMIADRMYHFYDYVSSGFFKFDDDGLYK